MTIIIANITINNYSTNSVINPQSLLTSLVVSNCVMLLLHATNCYGTWRKAWHNNFCITFGLYIVLFKRRAAFSIKEHNRNVNSFGRRPNYSSV